VQWAAVVPQQSACSMPPSDLHKQGMITVRPVGGRREEPVVTVLLVDVANVMGSRPDGWWRDRAGAASRLLGRLATVPGAAPAGPDGRGTCREVVAVVEGRARDVPEPDGVRVVRAAGSGDDALVAAAEELVRSGADLLVVTADRGLRARLPDGVAVTGPGWLLEELDRIDCAPPA
jgi:hypothetical protein